MDKLTTYTFDIPYTEQLTGYLRCYVKASSMESARILLGTLDRVDVDYEWVDSDPIELQLDQAYCVDERCAKCGEELTISEGYICNCIDGFNDPETTTPDAMYG